MEGWLLAVVLAVGIPVGILLFLAGFLALLHSIFAQTSRWNALAQRYGAIMEPEGRKLMRQTIKVGAVRWRLCVTVVLSPQGMYLHLGHRQSWLSAIRKHPPVLIPSAPAVVLPAAVTMVTSLFGTDTRMVRISALRASELRPGSLGVDFELHNNVMDGGRLVGHLSVLVNLGVGGQLRQIVYPQMNLSNNLMPSDLFKNGEYYAIRYFKIVHANFSLPQGIGLTPLNVKVCVFDHSGNPLLIKDFPLSGERSLSGGDTASANLVWKTKS